VLFLVLALPFRREWEAARRGARWTP
jgi:hypothetical protein